MLDPPAVSLIFHLSHLTPGSPRWPRWAFMKCCYVANQGEFLHIWPPGGLAGSGSDHRHPHLGRSSLATTEKRRSVFQMVNWTQTVSHLLPAATCDYVFAKLKTKQKNLNQDFDESKPPLRVTDCRFTLIGSHVPIIWLFDHFNQ